MPYTLRRVAPVLLAIGLVAAACGGDDSSTTTSQAEPADDADPTSSDSETPAPSSTAPASLSDAADLSSEVADGWTLRSIAEGTKPDLAIDPSGNAAITWLFESRSEGFVAYANAATDWAPETFVEGYFYGPIGLDFAPDGTAHIAYHDHQANNVQPALGDLTHASLRDGTWTVRSAEDDGHDGWDSTIRVGDDGIVRAAGIDPAQFGSPDGLEYYELVDDQWSVTAVGTGPIEYEWNVDLQVAPSGQPAISFFDHNVQDLLITTRGADDQWTAETIDSEGDTGRFSSLAFADDGSAHVSYWQADSGDVRYATNASGTWVSETIDTLGGVEIDFEGARRITSIEVDSAGRPWIAYSDTTGIWLASRADDGTWSSEQVVTAKIRPLGQLVSMALDDADTPHLTFFEVTGLGPLSGVVAYLTPAG